MEEIISSPAFGVFISILAYKIGLFIKSKLKLAIFNPLLIAFIILITFLSLTGISYEDYNKGGAIISFFLAPATVALALPLYKKFELFKKNAIPIIVGIFGGVVSGIICIIALCKVFNLTNELTISLIPKSVTTPIAMAISDQMQGISSITVMAVVITGTLGYIVGPYLNRIFKINDKVAFGIAMGNCSHAVGTSKAMEIGETEGAMSSLTIAIAGIITVFVAPFIWDICIKLFNI